MLSQRGDAWAPAAPCADPVSSASEDVPPPTPPPRTARVCLAGDRITLRNGTVTLPAGVAIVIEGALSLHNVTVRGDTAAAATPLVQLAPGAEVAMRGCAVLGNASGHGIGVGERSALHLDSCEVSGHRAGGVVVAGPGARLAAVATAFDSNGLNGVHATGGGGASFARCTFASNGAAALAATGAATCVAADACVGQFNGAGVLAHSGAALSITGCALERHGALARDAPGALRRSCGAARGGGAMSPLSSAAVRSALAMLGGLFFFFWAMFNSR